MREITNYWLIKEVSQSISSIVYKGTDVKTGKSVLIKTTQNDLSDMSVKYKKEFDLINNINSDYVIKLIDLLEIKNGIALVGENFDGCSLRDCIKESASKPLMLITVLRLAIEIAKALSEIHQLNIIHKNITPDAIIVNKATGAIKLIDFTLATTLSNEILNITNPHVLEGNLSYISPEQTGRMNRTLDYRTDFYSFGVTLYELLTGKVPFEFDDAISLIHAHIAR